LSVYPNPTNGIFNVTFGHSELVSESQTKLDIYTVLGEKALTETLAPPLKLQAIRGRSLRVAISLTLPGNPMGSICIGLFRNTENS
jgi:hypothetical protein